MLLSNPSIEGQPKTREIDSAEPEKVERTTTAPHPTINATIDPEIRQKHKDKMQQFQKYMVLGVLRERSPGIRRLTIWAKTKLHHSFKCLIIRDNNYIELQFT